MPIDQATIDAAVNPSHEPPYAGPAGIVEGVIRVAGAPPPKSPDSPPASCEAARSMYASRFRASAGGALADAVVGVTGYKGYVPALGDAVPISIHGCAFDARTFVLTFGQRVEVANADEQMYLPHLNGARNPALMVAVPHGDPVRMYPPQPGLYLLSDDMKHPWMRADVLVLKYATHAVSDKDGHYRIDRVPAGAARVSAVHPALGLDEAHTASAEVNVVAGQVTRADLTIRHSPDAAASPSASGSATPPLH